MILRLFQATSVCLALLAIPLAAQEASDIDLDTKKAIYGPLIGIEIRDPSLTSPVAAPALDFQLTTENKSNKARAKVGLRVGNDFFMDVIFTAPLADSDSEADPLDLDGLSRSSVVDVGLHYLAWRPRLNADVARGILEEYQREHPLSSRSAREDRSGPLSLALLKDEPELRKRLLEAIEWGSAYFAACRLKVGRQDFAYVDGDLKERSAQRTSRAFEAAIGILAEKFGYFGISLEYQTFYEGGQPLELIFPFGDGEIQQVRKVVLVPPSRRERYKVQLEFRRALATRVAISPRVSYFPAEKVTLAELPVYLFESPEEGLNGGVSLNWTSKHGGRFGLGIFIGAAFSLFP